jgi:hypothetical protein
MAGLRDRNDSARLNHSGLTPPNSYTISFTAGIKLGSTMWKKSAPAAYLVHSSIDSFPLDAIIQC